MADPGVFLDTGYVIALLSATDVYHTAAVRWADELGRRPRPVVTTTAVLVEVGDGFAKRGRWGIASPLLVAILADPQIDVVATEGTLVRRAATLQDARPDKRWGPTDCMSFLVMRDRGITDALACDADFTQAGFRALLLDPG